MVMISDENLRIELSKAGTLQENELLSRHTTMRLGGPARWFVQVSSIDTLLVLMDFLEKEGISWVVLGGGSNMVASDEGFAGVVIQPCLRSISMDETGLVIAESGAITALFARQVSEAGWAGWEWGVGLPGTIGGAVVGNAGCFGGETADGLVWVEAWFPEDHQIKRVSKEECVFGYRESSFKHQKSVILRAAWQLTRASDPEVSRARMHGILAKRKEEQPLGAASAGCLFKNPRLNQAQMRNLETKFGPLPPSVQATGLIPAGWLIERVGLKGCSVGGMRVSDRHANFTIQSEKATAADLRSLRDHIQKTVLEACGVALETEVRFL